MLGFAKKQDMIARINDMENTVSFLKKSIRLIMTTQHLLPLFPIKN